MLSKKWTKDSLYAPARIILRETSANTVILHVFFIVFSTIFLIRHIFHPQSITRKRLSMPFIQKSQLAKVDAKMEESVSNQKKKPNGMNATAPIDIMDEAVTSCALFRTVR